MNKVSFAEVRYWGASDARMSVAISQGPPVQGVRKDYLPRHVWVVGSADGAPEADVHTRTRVEALHGDLNVVAKVLHVEAKD